MKRKAIINERLTFKTKCNQWRELKIRGDVSALAELTGYSQVTISKAINHGVGSIDVLREVERYFEERQQQGNNDYFPDERKNYLT